MNELIDEIITENTIYLQDLALFKTSSISIEKLKGHYWIKSESDFIDVKNKTISELENTLARLTDFLIELKSSTNKTNDLLKLNDLFGLTNGKYYDFALNYDLYFDLDPDFYNLMKIKRDKYLQLSDKIKKAGI